MFESIKSGGITIVSLPPFLKGGNEISKNVVKGGEWIFEKSKGET